MKTKSLYLIGAVVLGGTLLASIQAAAQGGSWTTKAPMSTARQSFGVGVVNGILYAVGGGDAAGWPVSSVEAYDPISNTWTNKASLPVARERLGVGVVGGILYAVGGCTDNACGKQTCDMVEAYGPVGNAWTSKSPIPTRRRDFAVGVVNYILYAVGGYDSGDNPIASLQAYDPASNTWTSKSPMPTPRATLAVAVVDGILYAIGGDSAGTVEAYNPTSNTWTSRSPMPISRDSLAAGVINGIVYVVGGNSNYGIQSNVAVYNPATDTWTTNAPMPTARYALSAGVVADVLYALGGQGAMEVNEAFTPLALSINMYAGLTIAGQAGSKYLIEYCHDLNAPNWITLTNLLLPDSPHLFIDTSSPSQSKRFYRARLQP